MILVDEDTKSILAPSYVVSGAENVADATLDFTSLSPPGGLRILVIHDLVNTHYSWVSCAFGSAELRPYSSGNQLKRRTKKCNIFQGWLCLSEFLLCSRSPLCFPIHLTNLLFSLRTGHKVTTMLNLRAKECGKQREK